MFLLSPADFFSKITFSKILAATLSECQSVSMDRDEEQHSIFVGPDLGPNCLQRIFRGQKYFNIALVLQDE